VERANIEGVPLASLDGDGREEILGGDWKSTAFEASIELIWCEKFT